MCTGIIILNYNSSDYTIKCIQSIEQYNTAEIRYFIVDNGSTKKDETCRIEEFLQSEFPDQYIKCAGQVFPANKAKVVFILNPLNEGFAKGNNRGIRCAFCDPDIENILVVNNDILFTSDILPVLLSTRKQLRVPGILTPVLFNLNGPPEYSCARRIPSNWEIILPFLFFKKDFYHILSKSSNSQKLLKINPTLLHESFFPIGMPSGAFMFMEKRIWKELNGLDEGTFLYYEENILCKKLSEKGYINYCIPAVQALHIGGASTSKSNNLFLQKCNLHSADYYLCKYAGLTPLQHFVWWLVKSAWRLKFIFKYA